MTMSMLASKGDAQGSEGGHQISANNRARQQPEAEDGQRRLQEQAAQHAQNKQKLTLSHQANEEAKKTVRGHEASHHARKPAETGRS